MSNKRILIVDDDEKILKGILRQQGDDFDISLALGPGQALELIEDEGPFAVVVSDMRMPEMNGIELLRRIRENSPDTVRMILTGFAELQSVIAAINQGNIFRFLAKPCSETEMATALQDGLRQYALIEAERELVEGTLHASIQVLAEVLSLVNPHAFGRSNRVKSIVEGILRQVSISDSWQLEIAAMLSGLGCVVLPPDLVKKDLDGMPLSEPETDLFRKHPQVARSLLHNIPRLGPVADIIGEQLGTSEARDTVSPDTQKKIEMLRLAIDYERRERTVNSPLHALNDLKAGDHPYDPQLIDALADFVKNEREQEVIEIWFSELRTGLILAEDVRNLDGTLLIAKGHKISASALRLLNNLSGKLDVGATIKVAGTGRALENATAQPPSPLVNQS